MDVIKREDWDEILFADGKSGEFIVPVVGNCRHEFLLCSRVELCDAVLKGLEVILYKHLHAFVEIIDHRRIGLECRRGLGEQ